MSVMIQKYADVLLFANSVVLSISAGGALGIYLARLSGINVPAIYESIFGVAVVVAGMSFGVLLALLVIGVWADARGVPL